MATSLMAVDNLSPNLAQDSRLHSLEGRLHALAKSLNGQSEEQVQFNRQQLHEAAIDFESMFVDMMLKEMMPKEESSIFGKGLGSSTYDQLFRTELSKVISGSGQLGLAEMIEEQVAERVGFTDESNRTHQAIPGTTLNQALPQSLRRSVAQLYGRNQAEAADFTSFAGRASAFEEAPSELGLPVEGRVSSRFGMRIDPFTSDYRHHDGMDIAAPRGSSVKAAADGTVVFSGEMSGYGNVVILEHTGGMETRYAHNDNNLVRKGDNVTAGQAVATVGSTGRSTGPHVHFEVLQDGVSVDPQSFIACE